MGGGLYPLYSALFLQHDICGRALLQMSDQTLQRMGVTDASHRQQILREILKLRIKSDMLEMKDAITHQSALTGD